MLSTALILSSQQHDNTRYWNDLFSMPHRQQLLHINFGYCGTYWSKDLLLSDASLLCYMLYATVGKIKVVKLADCLTSKDVLSTHHHMCKCQLSYVSWNTSTPCTALGVLWKQHARAYVLDKPWYLLPFQVYQYITIRVMTAGPWGLA